MQCGILSEKFEKSGFHVKNVMKSRRRLFIFIEGQKGRNNEFYISIS